MAGKRVGSAFLAGLGLAVWAALPASAAPAITFAAAVTYGTGGSGGPGWHQTSLATADFTSDGAPDVVVADYFSSGDPRLMVNKGDGTFTSPGTAIPADFLTGTVVAGDVNLDGKQDLISTNASTVDVKLGSGDGTFAQGQKTTVFQGGQEDAIAHDLTSDGKLDLAILQRGGVQTLIGKGDGSFTTGPRSSFGTIGQSGFAVAQLNLDGKPDLVASEGISQQVIALTGDGQGGFTVSGSASTPFVPGSVVSGDFNLDGRDDAAVYREFNAPGSSLGIFLNNGSGGFTAGQTYDGGANPIAATGADLNLDGLRDLIGSDTTTSQLVVHAGNGNGTFAAAGKFGTALFPQTPKAADFNRDGKPDLATAGVTAGGATQLSILINKS